jgi:hypothetical protein
MASKRTLIGFAAGIMVGIAAMVHAGPYDGGHARASAQLSKPKPTCETILSNQAYDCTVTPSFGGQFTDCYSFIFPGVISSNFDLFPTELGATLGCSCNPSGSSKKPKFNQSKQFSCVGDASGTQFTFEGKVAGNGKKITGGRDASSTGITYIVSCLRRDTPCP